MAFSFVEHTIPQRLVPELVRFDEQAERRLRHISQRLSVAWTRAFDGGGHLQLDPVLSSSRGSRPQIRSGISAL